VLNRLADLLAANTGAHFGSYNASTYITTNLAWGFDPENIRSFSEYWGSCDIVWPRGAAEPFQAEKFFRRTVSQFTAARRKG
jgi:hypothetical protein